MSLQATLPELSCLSSLSDDVVELRLIRVLEAGVPNSRPPEAQFLSRVTEYRFSIHQRGEGSRIGRIHLRFTNDEEIVRAVGHTGYAIDEMYRRRGYATHSLSLIVSLAKSCQVSPLWVLIEPDNIASRKTAERAGFQLQDIVATSVEGLGLGIGERVCRYLIDNS
jgi:predicted acetyltransferase